MCIVVYFYFDLLYILYIQQKLQVTFYQYFKRDKGCLFAYSRYTSWLLSFLVVKYNKACITDNYFLKQGLKIEKICLIFKFHKLNAG